MKKLIFQVSVGKPSKLYTTCIDSVAEYCKKYNIPVILETHKAGSPKNPLGVLYAQEISLPFIEVYAEGNEQSLSEVKVTAEGLLQATYGIDKYVTVAQIGLARFADETQLKSKGDNIFTATPESGQPTIGAGKDLGFGKINAGSLEASNTDITAELTLLLRAQQAFNGSAKMMQADADVTRRLMDT